MTEPRLKLFVSKLPLEWTESTISDYFKSFASILTVSLFTNETLSKFHKGLGCAHVSFERKSEAEEVNRELGTPKGKLEIRWADGEKERLREPVAPSAVYVEYTASDGRPYYWDSVSGSTQWEKPPHATVISPSQAIQPYPVQSQCSANLFIFYLPGEWDENELRSHFSGFGNLLSAKIIYDKDSGKSKGFGFVNYDNPIDARNAVVAMNGFSVAGKRLKVQIKKELHKF